MTLGRSCKWLHFDWICDHNHLYVTITKYVFNNIDAESYVKPFRKCTQDTITK